jgi:hypothetical protein
VLLPWQKACLLHDADHRLITQFVLQNLSGLTEFVDLNTLVRRHPLDKYDMLRPTRKCLAQTAGKHWFHDRLGDLEKYGSGVGLPSRMAGGIRVTFA